MATKWLDAPQTISGGVRKWSGRITDCPVCWLVKGQENRLRLVGRRYPKEDRPVECEVCHRKWDSLRWFLDYWCQHWIPRIEAELQRATGIDAHNDMNMAEKEESLWRREQEVARAVENGWWSPRTRTGLQRPTEAEMQHYDPEKHVPMRERKPPAYLSD